MTTNLAGVLTDVGAQLIEEAYQAGKTVVITKMALGDGGGNPVEVKPSVTKLVREFHRQLLDNGVAEDAILGGSINYIPQADHRGKWLREFGLLDASGNLIVYAAYSPSQIPENPNMAAQFIIGMMVPVMNIEAIEVQVNPEGTVTQEEFHSHTHKLTLSGDATGSVTLGKDGATLEVTVKDDSHAHTIDNVDGLQQALDSKSPSNHTHPGTLTNPIPLSKEDLNTIIAPGAYRQDYDANATLVLNYPEAKSGSLIVTAGAGVQHRYHVYNTSRVYTRAQYDTGAFTPWARDYNTLNKPTPDELGAYPKTGGYLDGGIDSKDAIYARVGLIARSRAGSNGGTWLGLEAPENADPYISAKVNAENAPLPVITIGRNELTALKRLAAAAMRIIADAGLKFSPYEDLRGITWGLGVNAEDRNWGLHKYVDGVWTSSPFWVNAVGSVGMDALVVSGGSESSYHQVRNSGNPSVELHEPGKFAAMMYKPQGTATLRFCSSNGSGGESQGYGGVDGDGFFTVAGRFRANYPAANRSWFGKGQCSFWGETISPVIAGSLLGIAGIQMQRNGIWALENHYGMFNPDDNAENVEHVLSCTDGGGFWRAWRFSNSGNLTPANGRWRIDGGGDIYPARLNGANLIDWCQSGFAYKSHTHTAAQGNQDIVASGWGQIGTYMLAAVIPGHAAAMNPAATIAGSSLRPANCSEWGQNRDWALPGTWKCLGFVSDQQDDRWDDRTTLWIRIA